ncbi:hypothetical protein N658DRAFT_559140 [Parathielavia hyrcaniae]|uniref:Uncharacterized protein n=1 Tax=Parathielavia hyrcaniae TaxID=113614 RepID=A0AAN6T150_9PEZI|nr:hypothetical protein N658DRAFT_559140 [Parathielavia hyrcaniae]
MLSILATVIPLGLLLQTASGTGEHDKHTTSTSVGVSTIVDYVTVIETKTSTHWVDVSINSTVVNTITLCSTEIETITLTDTVVESETTTITNTTRTTTTDTDSVTLTETKTTATTTTTTDTTATTETTTDTTATTETTTDTTAITKTTTDTTATTETTYTTRTIFSTTYDPCPKSCSISADTVRLFFWPTDRPFTYPSTHVHPTFGYTFTSPSVYMLIPTAVGTNQAGATVGPSTTSWILPLQLHEVSTISGDATRQLALSDLRTDCPQNVAVADPTAIAELDPRCNPVLAAPTQVRSWAYPCNACGPFGLFDPPYAVPALTGGLVEPTTVDEMTSVTSTVVDFVTPTAATTAMASSAGEVSGTGTSTGTVVGTGVVESGTAGASGSSGGDGSGLRSTSTVLGVTPDEGASVTGGEPSSSLGATTSTVTATAAGSRPGLGRELGIIWLVPVLGAVAVMAWLCSSFYFNSFARSNSNRDITMDGG